MRISNIPRYYSRQTRQTFESIIGLLQDGTKAYAVTRRVSSNEAWFFPLDDAGVIFDATQRGLGLAQDADYQTFLLKR